MAKRKIDIRDSDIEYAEYKECEAQAFPKDKVKKLVVTCIPCNKRVELPIDDAVLTFHKSGQTDSSDQGHILLSDFITFPHILCKDCLGVADIEVI